MRKKTFLELLEKCQAKRDRLSHKQTAEAIHLRKQCFLCENARFCFDFERPNKQTLLFYRQQGFIILKSLLKYAEVHLFG